MTFGETSRVPIQASSAADRARVVFGRLERDGLQNSNARTRTRTIAFPAPFFPASSKKEPPMQIVRRHRPDRGGFLTRLSRRPVDESTRRLSGSSHANVAVLLFGGADASRGSADHQDCPGHGHPIVVRRCGPGPGRSASADVRTVGRDVLDPRFENEARGPAALPSRLRPNRKHPALEGTGVPQRGRPPRFQSSSRRRPAPSRRHAEPVAETVVGGIAEPPRRRSGRRCPGSAFRS